MRITPIDLPEVTANTRRERVLSEYGLNSAQPSGVSGLEGRFADANDFDVLGGFNAFEEVHFDGAVGGDETFASADEAQGVVVLSAWQVWCLDMGRRLEVAAPLDAATIVVAFPEFRSDLDDDVAIRRDHFGDAAPASLGVLLFG